MNGEPDYKQMYHALNRKRGEQYRELETLTKSVMGMWKLFGDVDRLVERLAVELDENG